MEDREVFLGGFYSPTQLVIDKLRPGAGFYVTSQRLFFFREDMDPEFNKIATGSARKDFVPALLAPQQNEEIVNRLSALCPPQISVRKNQIYSVEMKEPPGIFRTGFLKISLISGESLKLIIGKKKEFEYVQNLLRSFGIGDLHLIVKHDW